MQFVRGGPDVPDSLLEAHEDGRVVLFCGAGISYPAELPGFGGLVTKVYERVGEKQNALEASAIERRQYDTAIGLLESRILDGRAKVRAAIAKVLTPRRKLSNKTETHEALLVLSDDHKNSHRLITTNFDRLFERAIAKNGLNIERFCAPLLPVPKRKWSGIVYLHGVLPAKATTNDLDRLVVSSGDFGLAYLTERWAARFVSELFRNYTVCFVGYSIDDPVLRYMMDAIAADKLLGETPIDAFAFASYSPGQKDTKVVEWKAKNVVPILYSDDDDHALLHGTLREWAATYRDGILGKESIVVRHAGTPPKRSTAEDDYVGRMLWALTDQRALPAKRFAELDPPPPLEWLEAMQEERFGYDDLQRFGVRPSVVRDNSLKFSFLSRYTPYHLAPRMALFSTSRALGEWDEVMTQIARWLVRHLDKPEMIKWFVAQSGDIHAGFLVFIGDAVAKATLPKLAQVFWRLALSGRIRTHRDSFQFLLWLKALKRNGLTHFLRMELRFLLAPMVEVTPPIEMEPEEKADVSSSTDDRIRSLFNWEVVLRSSHVDYGVKQLAGDQNWAASLPDLLADVTMLLQDALDLMNELGAANSQSDLSYVHRPSIADSDQNRGFRDWTILIELVRDAWLATSELKPGHAKAEVYRWSAIRYPVFRRLALFAATTKLFGDSEAVAILLEEDSWWLWSAETEHEALRLLVHLAPLLDGDAKYQLEAALMQGPPRKLFKPDLSEDDLARTVDREIWLRLSKLQFGGADLGIAAASKLSGLVAKYPKWRLSEDLSDEYPFWISDGHEFRRFTTTPKNRRELAHWLRDHPENDFWQEDDWQERCRKEPARSAAALLTLAKSGHWPPERWREASHAWRVENVAEISWRHLRNDLSTAPEGFIRELGASLAGWLEAVAKTSSADHPLFFQVLNRLVESYRHEQSDVVDDPVHSAINHAVGRSVEAALKWWFNKRPHDNQGIEGPFRALLTVICDRSSTAFRNGRVLLSSNLIAFFRVDPDWTKVHMLPLLEWRQNVAEARAAWAGFLWSPRIYGPLLERIQQSFLETATHYEELEEHSGEQYAALLAYVGLELVPAFTPAQLASAHDALPPQALERAASAVREAIASKGEKGGEYWRNRVQPYIRRVWPKAVDKRTENIGESFARICIAARSKFADALNELRPWLLPIEYPDVAVAELHESGICRASPEAAVDWIDKIIGARPRWGLLPEYFASCLEEIKTAAPALIEDPRFKRLSALAVQFRR